MPSPKLASLGHAEQLEDRIAPAVSAVRDDATGILRINLGGADDTVTVSATATPTTVSVIGTGMSQAELIEDISAIDVADTSGQDGEQQLTFGGGFSVLIRTPDTISSTGVEQVNVATNIASDNGQVTLSAGTGISLIGGTIDTPNGKQILIVPNGGISTDANGTDMTSPNIEITAGKPIADSSSSRLRILGGSPPSVLKTDTSGAPASPTDPPGQQDQFFEVFDGPGFDAGPGTTIPTLNAGNGTVHLYVGTFLLDSAGTDAVADTTSLDIDESLAFGPAVLDLNGTSEAIASLSGAGTVTNGSNAPATLTVGGMGRNSTFSGNFTDAGPLSLVKTGSGTLTLTGVLTVGGTVTVDGGTLVVTNTVGDGTADPAVVATGTGRLTGTGTIQGTVRVGEGGTLQPGAPDGPGDPSVARLATGSVTFQAGSRLTIRVNQPGSGLVADHLLVSGTVTIDPTADLVIIPGDNQISLGTNFTIVDNDGTDAVVGTFGNMPEGGVMTVARQTFRISYRGGTGNDVTLTAVTDTTPPTAALSAPNVTGTSAPNPYRFTVTYVDGSDVSAAGFAAGNVAVTTPAGVAAVAVSFVSATPAGNGSPRTATYQFAPPGGSWDAADNGTYTVRVGSVPVADTAGNALTAGTVLGTFSVSVPPPSPPSPPPPPSPPANGLGPVRPVVVGGAPDGSVRLTSGGGNSAVNPFGNTGAATRTASADVNNDGVADVVAVTGPGTPLRVAVLSGADGSVLVAPFDPFGGNFLGGGYVAAADLDRDGRAEFAVTPDQGGGPRVTVFTLGADGTRTQRANFFGIDDAAFRGGARAALGDVNRDGTPDVVVAAGFGGGPRTAIFEGGSVLAGSPTRLVADFFAFPGADATNLRNGSFVAAGDITGDGFADLVFGGGPGGAPRVFVLSGALVSAGDVAGAQAGPVANFFVAGDLTDRGGARVAVTNADGDGFADLAVGSGAGRPARVRLYLGKDFAGGGEPPATDLDPLGGAVLADGVFVG